MALKKKVTAEEYAKLNKVIQAEYKADGEDYVVDVEGGFEDTTALKNALTHERTQRKEATTLLKTLTAERDTLVEERDNILKGAIPKADVEKLEGSYKTKLEKREKELNEQIGTLQSNLSTNLVDNVATQLATKISTAPKVLLPHIRGRLKMEMVEGKAVTRVLDTAGAPSALTVDDLEKEFLANAEYKPILIGSKGSGGGARGGSGGGGATGVTKTRSEFASMNPVEQAAFIQSKGTVADQ